MFIIPLVLIPLLYNSRKDAISSCGKISKHNSYIFLHRMRHQNKTQVCAKTHTHKTQVIARFPTHTRVVHTCAVYCSQLQQERGNRNPFHLAINLSQFSGRDTMTSAPSLQEITEKVQQNSFIIHTGLTSFCSSWLTEHPIFMIQREKSCLETNQKPVMFNYS